MCGRGLMRDLCNLRLSGGVESLESKGRPFLRINLVRAVRRDLLNLPSSPSDVLLLQG
jgi:hypothetical protein